MAQTQHSLVEPAQDANCSQCGKRIGTWLSNSQNRYFGTGAPNGPFCEDCLSIYATDEEVLTFFDQIKNALHPAERWKWELSDFTHKFIYALRAKRLIETGGWYAFLGDPFPPKLPNEGPPDEATFKTALELLLKRGKKLEERVNRPTAVDLFCGAGGATLGMIDSGFAVTGVENGSIALRTHALNADQHLKADLSTVKRRPQMPKSVTWVHASPPCKGFSRAGKQDSGDKRNELTWTTVKWIAELTPQIVTIEQVPGFKDGNHHDRLRRELKEIGYTVAVEELNAADYGVPQLRTRLLFVGIKNNLDIEPSFPAPSHAPAPQQTLSGESLHTYRTVDDVLPLEDDAPLKQNHRPPNHTEDVEKRFSQLDPGQNVTDLENATTKKASQRRLDPNKPAPTITGVPSDYVHPYEDRCLTIRELSRLQSFPDWYLFTGPEKGGGSTRGKIASQAEQVGNAVPPLLMRAIGTHIKTLLDNALPEE